MVNEYLCVNPAVLTYGQSWLAFEVFSIAFTLQTWPYPVFLGLKTTKVPVNFVTSEVHSVKLFSVILCGKVNRGHPLSTYAKFSEKLTFLTP